MTTLQEIIKEMEEDIKDRQSKNDWTDGYDCAIESYLPKLKSLLSEQGNERKDEWEEAKCDVCGCDKPTASQGMYWNDTGYWCLCSKHSSDGRNKLPQPEMKDTAINREISRDKKTGQLPTTSFRDEEKKNEPTEEKGRCMNKYCTNDWEEHRDAFYCRTCQEWIPKDAHEIK